jgi:sucrose phosphorylase
MMVLQLLITKKVDNNHGDWNDFKKISCINFKVMVDLVINHCSSSNELFENFLNNDEPGSDFFIHSKKKFSGLSKVVRPRTSNIIKRNKN